MIGTDHPWRARYNAHIKSARWKNMNLCRLRGGRCERCPSTLGLELHHKTYERLGRELMSDLEILCSSCHAKADKERENVGIVKSRIALEEAGLNTFATKKYGDDWQYYCEEERVSEEFDSWLENKVE